MRNTPLVVLALLLAACQQPAPPARPEPLPPCEKTPTRVVREGEERRCWEVGGVLCEPDIVDPYLDGGAP